MINNIFIIFLILQFGRSQITQTCPNPDSVCPPGHICNGGVCIIDNRGSCNCPPNQVCNSGNPMLCEDPPTQPDCTITGCQPGFTCSESLAGPQCVPLQRCGMMGGTTTGERLDSRVDQGQGAARVGSPGGGGDVTTCLPNEICLNGQCTLPPLTTPSPQQGCIGSGYGVAPCLPNEVCLNGYCTLPLFTTPAQSLTTPSPSLTTPAPPITTMPPIQQQACVFHSQCNPPETLCIPNPDGTSTCGPVNGCASNNDCPPVSKCIKDPNFPMNLGQCIPCTDVGTPGVRVECGCGCGPGQFCYQDNCIAVTTTTPPPSCTITGCPTGFTCSGGVQPQCVPIQPCPASPCPPYGAYNCINGQCIPAQPCFMGNPCPGGQICNGQICILIEPTTHPPTCPAVPCPVGMVCQNGICVNPPSPPAAPTTRRPLLNLGLDSTLSLGTNQCTGVTCPTGQICQVVRDCNLCPLHAVCGPMPSPAPIRAGPISAVVHTFASLTPSAVPPG